MTHEEWEALVKQVFHRITIYGKDFVDIEPEPEYALLFATIVTGQKVGYQEMDSTPCSTSSRALTMKNEISQEAQRRWAGREKMESAV